MDVVIQPPAGREPSLDNLMYMAKLNASRFCREWNEVGFNFLLQRIDGAILPGDFNPAKIISADGRSLARKRLASLLKEKQAGHYVIFTDVKTKPKGYKQVLVAGFSPGRNVAWLFDIEALKSTKEPEPAISSESVDGWWANLIQH